MHALRLYVGPWMMELLDNRKMMTYTGNWGQLKKLTSPRTTRMLKSSTGWRFTDALIVWDPLHLALCWSLPLGLNDRRFMSRLQFTFDYSNFLLNVDPLTRKLESPSVDSGNPWDCGSIRRRFFDQCLCHRTQKMIHAEVRLSLESKTPDPYWRINSTYGGWMMMVKWKTQYTWISRLSYSHGRRRAISGPLESFSWLKSSNHNHWTLLQCCFAVLERGASLEWISSGQLPAPLVKLV